MKKLLNTLYITRQESYLHKERETIVVKNGDDKLGQFPALRGLKQHGCSRLGRSLVVAPHAGARIKT